MSLLSSCHLSITFTVELEGKNTLQFLDILVIRVEDGSESSLTIITYVLQVSTTMTNSVVAVLRFR